MRTYAIYRERDSQGPFYSLTPFDGGLPGPFKCVSVMIVPLRRTMQEIGLTCFTAAETDDPRLVETWE